MALSKRYNVFASEVLQGASFSGKYEFPQIAPIHINRISTISFDRISRSLNSKSPLWVHFYIYDNRFQSILPHPDKIARFLCKYSGVIGLDNSLYRDLPLVEQIHSVYLNRLIDFWWQSLDIPVIPNVVWGDIAAHSISALMGFPVKAQSPYLPLE